MDLAELTVYFKLPYARTCHSMQGLSVEGEVTIFEVDNPNASVEWLYTAITRTTNLKNVYIFRGELPNRSDPASTMIRERIYSHKDADKKAGRKFNEKSYITEVWILDTLKRAHYCAECEQSLDITKFSVDRINNALAHTKNNCRIICLPCNLANKKDYEINF